jgi:hypothetical protein
MARITCRCDVCCSEILVGTALPAPQICLLCRLSAEEALSAVDEEVTYRARMLHPAHGNGLAERELRLS